MNTTAKSHHHRFQRQPRASADFPHAPAAAAAAASSATRVAAAPAPPPPTSSSSTPSPSLRLIYVLECDRLAVNVNKSLALQLPWRAQTDLELLIAHAHNEEICRMYHQQEQQQEQQGAAATDFILSSSSSPSPPPPRVAAPPRQRRHLLTATTNKRENSQQYHQQQTRADNCTSVRASATAAAPVSHWQQYTSKTTGTSITNDTAVFMSPNRSPQSHHQLQQLCHGNQPHHQEDRQHNQRRRNHVLVHLAPLFGSADVDAGETGDQFLRILRGGGGGRSKIGVAVNDEVSATTLTLLDCSRNFIGENGLLPLLPVLRRAAPTLERLLLDNCGLTTPSVQQLLAVVSDMPRLVELDLRNNPISHEGGKLLHREARRSCMRFDYEKAKQEREHQQEQQGQNRKEISLPNLLQIRVRGCDRINAALLRMIEEPQREKPTFNYTRLQFDLTELKKQISLLIDEEAKARLNVVELEPPTRREIAERAHGDKFIALTHLFQRHGAADLSSFLAESVVNKNAEILQGKSQSETSGGDENLKRIFFATDEAARGFVLAAIEERRLLEHPLPRGVLPETVDGESTARSSRRRDETTSDNHATSQSLATTTTTKNANESQLDNHEENQQQQQAAAENNEAEAEDDENENSARLSSSILSSSFHQPSDVAILELKRRQTARDIIDSVFSKLVPVLPLPVFDASLSPRRILPPVDYNDDEHNDESAISGYSSSSAASTPRHRSGRRRRRRHRHLHDHSINSESEKSQSRRRRQRQERKRQDENENSDADILQDDFAELYDSAFAETEIHVHHGFDRRPQRVTTTVAGGGAASSPQEQQEQQEEEEQESNNNQIEHAQRKLANQIVDNIFNCIAQRKMISRFVVDSVFAKIFGDAAPESPPKSPLDLQQEEEEQAKPKPIAPAPPPPRSQDQRGRGRGGGAAIRYRSRLHYHHHQLPNFLNPDDVQTRADNNDDAVERNDNNNENFVLSRNNGIENNFDDENEKSRSENNNDDHRHCNSSSRSPLNFLMMAAVRRRGGGGGEERRRRERFFPALSLIEKINKRERTSQIVVTPKFRAKAASLDQLSVERRRK